MHISTRTDGGCDPSHDEGYCEEGDDGAASRQGDGECHIASCQHGKDVAGTATRTASDEHDAQKEEGFEVEDVPYNPCNEGQEDDLSDDSCQHGPRALENQAKIVRTQGESEVEHQQRQNR